MTPKKPKIMIIGAGLSGSMAAISAAEAGAEVRMISSCHPFRASSISIGEGIGCSIAPYTLEKHIADSLSYAGSDVVEAQIREMCTAAPRVVNLIERMGVLFDRDVEGRIRIFGDGIARDKGVVKSGDNTAQRVLSVLTGQLARYSIFEKIVMDVGWEFLTPIIEDGGRCAGAVAMNMKNMEVSSYRADAVIICTGGYSGIYSNTTRSRFDDGSAMVSCYKKGAELANVQVVEFEQHTLRSFGKNRKIDPSLYNSENNFTEFDELEMCNSSSVFESAASYSLGGLTTDQNHATNIEGLYAAGEAAITYKGSGILPGNKILASLYGGMTAGRQAAEWTLGMTRLPDENVIEVMEKTRVHEDVRNSSIASREGSENAHVIAEELSKLLFDVIGPKRSSGGIENAMGRVAQLKVRLESAPLLDRSEWANYEVVFMRRLFNRFELAKVMMDAALKIENQMGLNSEKKDFATAADEAGALSEMHMDTRHLELKVDDENAI